MSMYREMRIELTTTELCQAVELWAKQNGYVPKECSAFSTNITMETKTNKPAFVFRFPEPDTDR